MTCASGAYGAEPLDTALDRLIGAYPGALARHDAEHLDELTEPLLAGSMHTICCNYLVPQCGAEHPLSAPRRQTQVLKGSSDVGGGLDILVRYSAA
jgi:hypothetical protein